jgi:hypothetical protein
MAEINITIKAGLLGKSLEDLSVEIEQQLEEDIRNVVKMGYASIEGTAELGLHSSRQDYMSGLKLHELAPNEYLIVLEGKFPNALESGYSGFDVKEGMLNSKKVVSTGTRSGQPWVQQSKEGQRYAHVPFQQRPFSKEAQSADLGSAIKKLKAVNKQGEEQRFTKIFSDENGNPMSGKVAKVDKVKGFPELDNITKYQKVTKNGKTGVDVVQSIYMTYRTVSDNGGDWMHPGFAGLKAFDDAEAWMDSQIDDILNRLLK